MWKDFFSFSLYACLGTIFVISNIQLTVAQVRQSTNYQIQSDSLNFGGGFSSSTNYVQQSTFGEVGTGEANSTNYALRAGYQQMQEVYIAISAVADLSLSPNISGVTGGSSSGSTTVTVTTDSPAGYSLSIQSAANPAMQKGIDSIANYAPAGATPDFAFTFAAGESQFGYSPEGVDIAQRFKDNGASCDIGTSDTQSRCWDGLFTTPVVIASAIDPNHPNGATTSIKFRVGIGSSMIQPEGLYTATTTLTALPL
jgi:hypothetical protein